MRRQDLQVKELLDQHFIKQMLKFNNLTIFNVLNSADFDYLKRYCVQYFTVGVLKDKNEKKLQKKFGGLFTMSKTNLPILGAFKNKII